jgi:PAS domain S-box-containing protein
VAIAVFNPEGEFVQASGRAEEMIGLERDEITDRTYNDPAWDITTPEGEPIPDEELPFARVMATGEPVRDVEHTIKWPNGERRLLSVSGAPLRSPDGELEGAVFHINDITEQREIEQRFRGVFENAGLGIALIDESGAIFEANPALESMLGYEAGELQNVHLEHLTHPEHLDADKQRYQELIAGERDQYQLEKRYLRQDGEAFWGYLTVSRREVTDGFQVVSMVENIDDRKQQEQQLRAAKEEAERMSRLKSAFLANMSHEIRTPLTSILGFAEMIGEQVADDAEGTIPQHAHLIEKSGRRLLNTLDRVLNLSRLEAGEMNFSAGALDLAAEVKDTARQFGPQAEEAGVELQMEIGEGPIWCRADKDGLQVVLRNLLSNAIKYTESGGTVWVRTRADDETVVLEVEDTGIGMDPEETDELFEAFVQESEGIGREYEGTGLGLTVAHRIVDEMGGFIEVETRKGGGSCFTVRLPKAEDAT